MDRRMDKVSYRVACLQLKKRHTVKRQVKGVTKYNSALKAGGKERKGKERGGKNLNISGVAGAFIVTWEMRGNARAVMQSENKDRFVASQEN